MAKKKVAAPKSAQPVAPAKPASDDVRVHVLKDDDGVYGVKAYGQTEQGRKIVQSIVEKLVDSE